MSNSSPGAIRLLHVDDEADFAETAGAFLEREDGRITVETAEDADVALSRLAETAVDCVVSDFDMPGRNGIEFLRVVRAEYPDLPFILFTGKGSEEVASEAISAGVTDYLQKEVGTDQYAILANRIGNVVEQRRAEQARKRHLEAIETAQEGISILDADGRFIYVNDAYAALYRYDREAMLGEHWSMLYPDEDLAAVESEILPTVRETGYWRGETTGLRADGSTFVEDHTLATTEHGELVCSVQDRSDRKARKQAIEALHSTARSFIQAGSVEEVAEIAVDAVRDILDIPENGIHRYDDDADGLVPVAWTDRTEELVGEPPTFEPGEGLAWETFESGEPAVYTDVTTESARYNRKTPVRSQIVLPLDDHGVHVIVSPDPDAFDETDVSLAQTVAAHATAAFDRVERERELAQQNDRLETFTSVVSHDLRGPLTVAVNELELARAECESPSLDAADRALDRTATLLDDLQAFARAGAATLDVEPVELAAVCRTSWQQGSTGDATLVTETDRRVLADDSRLQELFENLFRNAVAHGSDVTVTVGDLDGGFSVADDGPGIPPEDRERVFDHGYSTRGRGTGFGLSIVQEIADAHGWEVAVTESDDGGARFEVTGVDVVQP
jgi:PAS domain S-box-containing protein